MSGKRDFKIVRARAPLRISFAGGGTDVSPFCDECGGSVLNATVRMYAYTSILPGTGDGLKITSLDLNQTINLPDSLALQFDGKMDLAKGVLKRLGLPDEPLDVLTHNDAPPGSGLGSSSAMVVSILAAFRELMRIPVDEYEIAHLAYLIEREDVGISGGRQDQYASVFGGFNFMEFRRDEVLVNPLSIKPEIVSELEYSIVMCFTGGTRSSSSIIDEQVKNVQESSRDPISAMHELKQHAMDMKRALLKGKLDDVGKLLDDAWQAKKRMASSISNPRIDEFYAEAIRAGALGGKISGAGGGGFMMFYCPGITRHKVIEKLELMGGSPSSCSFELNGIESWLVS